jgi:protein-S-isoprenylcysteine O-methyltransferase Ste14
MSKVLERQGYQLIAYIGLGGFLLLATLNAPESHGRAWGLSTAELVALSWVLAGLFQFGVALVWRLELHHRSISARFGRWGFLVFRIVFPLVIGARMLLIIPISQSAPHTLEIHPAVFWVLVLGPMPFILWALYSVAVYFGFTRATGADHFDPSYRSTTLETRGIFKYVRHPIYAVILLLLYHPGLFYESLLGLIAAACHHAFVWCHYHCTEKRDIREIYGANA